jgi:hypothetical protein
MKDGCTHLAHKAEHAVDQDTSVVVAVTMQQADKGDTAALDLTLCEAGEAVAQVAVREAEQRPDEKPKVNVEGIEEMVADKGVSLPSGGRAREELSGAQLYSGAVAEGAAALGG